MGIKITDNSSLVKMVISKHTVLKFIIARQAFMLSQIQGGWKIEYPCS